MGLDISIRFAAFFYCLVKMQRDHTTPKRAPDIYAELVISENDPLRKSLQKL